MDILQYYTKIFNSILNNISLIIKDYCNFNLVISKLNKQMYLINNIIIRTNNYEH